MDLWEVLKQRESAIIFGRAGQGKTTLLHWAYMKLIQEPDCIPLLFTLRRKGTVDYLGQFVRQLETRACKGLVKEAQVVLLVDGYDEISVAERKLVSEALMSFQSLKRGVFYVTCRTIMKYLISKRCIATWLSFLAKTHLDI
jgi:DNA replication protein DnaC